MTEALVGPGALIPYFSERAFRELVFGLTYHVDGYGLPWQPSEIERMAPKDIIHHLELLGDARDMLRKGREELQKLRAKKRE